MAISTLKRGLRYLMFGLSSGLIFILALLFGAISMPWAIYLYWVRYIKEITDLIVENWRHV